LPPAPRVTVLLPLVLRDRCAGTSEVELAAPDVRAVLEELGRRHPDLYRHFCDETGAVRRHIGVFVNRSHVRDREGLETPLAEGDVVTILPAVSGG